MPNNVSRVVKQDVFHMSVVSASCWIRWRPRSSALSAWPVGFGSFDPLLVSCWDVCDLQSRGAAKKPISWDGRWAGTMVTMANVMFKLSWKPLEPHLKK